MNQCILLSACLLRSYSFALVGIGSFNRLIIEVRPKSVVLHDFNNFQMKFHHFLLFQHLCLPLSGLIQMVGLVLKKQIYVNLVIIFIFILDQSMKLIFPLISQR